MIPFGTKAETLQAIRPHLSKSQVCPSVTFTAEEWARDPKRAIGLVQVAFAGAPVIVRSSAVCEDSALTAMAGMHDSILNVNSASELALSDAISKVAASYERPERNADPRDQILVQPMILNVSMSGVVFTQDLNTGGPYYCVNYDDVSGKTDTVTSGMETNKTLLIHRGHAERLKSTRFNALMSAVEEIESLMDSPGLDIEFAIDGEGTVYLLQVRRLAVRENWNRDVSRRVDVALKQAAAFTEPRFAPAESVLGHKSILTEMSDWNPAELIGAAPRRLALSLYQYLITDSTWAEARAQMGYRDLSGRPLLVSLGGRPYVDVRESFNSFLPADLPDAIGEKLVSSWLERLERTPELHDKIEFDVAVTAYPFDFRERALPELLEAGLSEEEAARYQNCLLRLTQAIVQGPLLPAQVRLLDSLQTRHREIATSLERGAHPLQAAKALLIDCRRLGARPFAIAARCAFVAEDLLRSLARRGAVSPEAARGFRSSVRTVLSDFIDSVQAYQAGEMSEEDFFRRFGHLRPGAYNILSQRYDQRADLLMTVRGPRSRAPLRVTEPEASPFSREETAAIGAELSTAGFRIKVGDFLVFLRKAIEARELVKFEFTRNLSDALEIVASWGASMGLNREELSHLSIREIVSYLSESPLEPSEERLRRSARLAAEEHEATQALRLPYLISNVADLHIVPLLRSRPNLVTQKSIRAPTASLTGQEIRPRALKGRIVLIEGADPGYDWIFLHEIAGLVTKYGGANSHMAIRCAELGVPAAIGCGEQLFERCLQAREIALDCGGGSVEPSFV